jgi:hypothetical protein
MDANKCKDLVEDNWFFFNGKIIRGITKGIDYWYIHDVASAFGYDDDISVINAVSRTNIKLRQYSTHTLIDVKDIDVIKEDAYILVLNNIGLYEACQVKYGNERALNLLNSVKTR